MVHLKLLLSYGRSVFNYAAMLLQSFFCETLAHDSYFSFQRSVEIGHFESYFMLFP